MSDAVAEKAEKAPAAAGGGNKKILIIVLAVNVVLVGGLGYVVISNKNHAEPAKAAGKDKAEEHEADAEGEGHEDKAEGEAEEAEEGKKDDKHAAGKFGPLLEIGSFVANLATTPGQQPRYCKATVYAEVKNEESKVAVEGAVVPIKAEALMMISNARAEDVIGQEKIEMLSAALLKRANKLVGKSAIKRIYFSELVVQ
jgi:flagellar basal body-associated protein FliL